MAFGSFWEGMKLVKLNNDLATVAQPEKWYTIARRPRNFAEPDSSAGNAAIEGPFIFKKNNLYYLFVSWDYCCSGNKSDYKIAVGRSKKIQGPYLDKNGKDMARGGGTVIRAGDMKEFFAVGHNSAYTFDGVDYLVYHGYSVAEAAASKLVSEKLKWDKDGWPVIGERITPKPAVK